MSDEIEGLGATIGNFAGANIVALMSLVAGLVANGTLKPRQGQMVLRQLGRTAGSPEIAKQLEQSARSFMSYRTPRKGKRRV